MNILTESGSSNGRYCELCGYIEFLSYTDFHIHHLKHIRQPKVRLVKLNPSLCEKLRTKSYKVKTGVARRSPQDHVPPLKISLVKQPGLKQFHVVKKENSPELISPKVETFDPSYSIEDIKTKNFFRGFFGVSEVEGKNLLERFGAKILGSRKGKPTTQSPSGNGRRDSDGSQPSPEVKAENLLERLSGIGGISISPKIKPPNGNPESKTSGISISTKQKCIDLNQLKKLKDQDSENDKKAFDRSEILKKLSGSGLISIAPKSLNRPETDRNSKDSEPESPNPESQEVPERPSSGNTILSSNSSDSKSSTDGQTFQVNSSEEVSLKAVNENSSESCEQKKFVRVKNSTYSKTKILPKRQTSEEESAERTSTTEEPKEREKESESGIDILERLTDSLNNSVGSEKTGTNSFIPAEVEDSKDSNPDNMEEPLLSTDSASAEHGPNSNASPPRGSPAVTPDFEGESESNPKEQEQGRSLLVTPPSSSGGLEEESSEYNPIDSHQTESFGENNSVAEENNEITENAVSFASLTSEDQSQEADEQPTSFWTDIQNNSNNVDQPQQDPLLTSDNSVPNGDGMNQNFLHNFLNEPQPPTNNLPSENSEFMSLDRLAQTQHQQPPYDLNSGESNTPMEQLSQQVQRIPNPTPQINVISQHHMQAPQPPQLHSGVPLSPQHLSQQSAAYDALSHMQPPMPPPLYQGYNMFNQNYPPQAPQQMPRPPMLQQRPHIQPRSFQSLAAPHRPRFRSVNKRNAIRLPLPEMAPPKQRRVDPPLQARPQMQNMTAPPSIPSGITVTPPKKALEANKVANVLASRGITVTPAASRQTSQARPQPQRSSAPGQPPILNISSAISITSSSQNRGGGGFAVPGPRRNTPIVNHHVERPERCTTVDLTQDDDIPQAQRNRGTLGRFSCNQCGKIFTSSISLESHRASHRAAAVLPYKCDKCTAQYSTSAQLQQHKLTYHKVKQSASDLAIPIVDLNHPGAREQLLKCGVYNFIPLSQLQSNNNGYFGVPIIQLDTAKEKAVSDLNTLGAGNILVLGKMKALAPQLNR